MRVALRSLLRQPGMATLAVIALALGIGLTTTMFSIVNGALLRGLPFPESDRILHIAPYNIAEQDDIDARVHTFAEFRDRQQSFEELAGFQFQTANVVGPSGTAVRYQAAAITANTFRLLRVTPLLGRDFRDDESRPGTAPAVIIGEKVWQEQFGRSPSAIGRSLRINGTVMTVVGVMPPKFRFPSNHELWPALVIDPLSTKFGEGPVLETIGRLKPGITRDEAGAEFATLWRQLEQAYPDRYTGGYTVEIKPYIREFIGDQVVGVLWTMLVAVFGVMIIACVNVANLVMARAVSRTREVAVRTAIGATRWQVVRQMLAEVLVLAVAGALLGLALAQTGITLFNRAIVDTQPPFWIDIRIDAMVLLFVTVATLVAALVSGIVPALRASKSDLAQVMNEEGRNTGLRMGRFSRALVVAELALSFGLLVMAGLMIQSVANIARADFGFAMKDVWSARLTLAEADYPDEARRLRFADAALERLRALPGVQAVALGTAIPLGAPHYAIKLPDRQYASENDYHDVHGVIVSPDYFRVFRVAPREGRVFDARDRETGAPSVIVNESMARRYFPEGAIGRRLAIATGRHQEWREVVGVVPDLGMGESPGDRVRDAIYLPIAQMPPTGVSVLAQVAGSPLNVSAPARDAIRALDVNLPLFNIGTVQEGFEEGTWPFRVFGSLFMAFGIAALFLATVGLYGVMAFSVSRRTQEIGVRMAMGAAARDVLLMVLRQGAWQVGIGIVLGAGLGIGLGSFATLLLFHVSPYDPAILLMIASVLAATALGACLVPARRAASVDPMVALRYQ
ncbi:MAG TPA: ABC transporter permease [Vicinamibacterales bacterium]|nr:ABC transporter permease [Vicinamibacterales bacterium]